MRSKEEDRVVKTIAKAVFSGLNANDRAYLCTHTDASEHHFGLGMYIRNEFIYGQDIDLAIIDPDGFSKKVVEQVIKMCIENENERKEKKLLWIIAPGEDAYMWSVFRREGVAAIDWNVDTGFDLSELSKDDIYEIGLGPNDSKCVWDFCNEIRQGDIIVAKKGTHKLVGIGVVTKAYYYVDSDEYFKYDIDAYHTGNYRHRVDVKWMDVPEVKTPNKMPIKTLTPYEGEKRDYYLSLFKLTVDDFTSFEEKSDKILIPDIEKPELSGDERDVIVKARINQSPYRRKLLSKYNTCCLCGVSNPSLLIASHIKPWKQCDDKEKVDEENGLLLCPSHDKLFDSGLISFDEDGRILISKSLSEDDAVWMNVNDDMRIEVSKDSKKYLKYHREKRFKG